MSHASNKTLRDRSKMLAAVRSFFHERQVLEVDCPLLFHAAPIDAHIDLFDTRTSEGNRGYFHSSPEYGMKRLLARGLGSIYQLSHVYRKGEAGSKHNPEFSMIEWYRPGFTFEAFLQESLDLISLFIGEQPYETLSYEEAITRYTNLTLSAPEEELNMAWGCDVEPKLGQNGLTVVQNYPADQSALARVKNGFAERFEIYFDGVELGNGYHELTDAEEHRKRFAISNAKREALGKEALPIDTFFLEALEAGIPDSYGIAIGFDRLMMLRHQTKDISTILPFSWEEC